MLQREWFDEGCICIVTMPPIVSREMLEEHEIEMTKALNAAPRDVCVIADMSAMQKILSLNEIFILKHMRHPKLKRAMTLGLTMNPMARFFVPIVSQMVGLQYKDFASREDALAFIAQQESAT